MSAGRSTYTGPGVPYIDIFTARSMMRGTCLMLLGLAAYFVTDFANVS